MPMGIIYVHQLYTLYQKGKAFIIKRPKVCADFQIMKGNVFGVWNFGCLGEQLFCFALHASALSALLSF